MGFLANCLFGISTLFGQANLSHYYTLEKSWCDPDSLDDVVELVETFIKEHYTEENLKEHIAYLSDQQPNRDSFAFVVYTSSKDSNRDLPGIAFERLPKELQQLQRKTESMLGVTKGRLLFNVQRYKNQSEFLPTHFDGEFFSFSKSENDTIEIHQALRSKMTGVLSLINNAVGGGTKVLSSDLSVSKVVESGPGDLLLFRNDQVFHGAESFTLQPNVLLKKNKYVRYTIGWRSLDQGCVFYENGKNQRSVPYEEAVQMHKDYLKNVWPLRYKEIKQGKKAAF